MEFTIGKYLLTAITISLFLINEAIGQQKYAMQRVAIQSRWVKDVSSENALEEYPMPGMVRNNWTNLKGLWNYAIKKREESMPTSFTGKVPMSAFLADTLYS